jgi:probable selenium-dependent hydroxylase accessory protein YqeC
MIELIDKLNLKDNELISFVGAGGKTTLIFVLAQALKDFGKKVLVTTTTKILLPDENQYDTIIFDSSNNIEVFKKNYLKTVTCLGNSFSPEHNKIKGVDDKYIDEIFKAGIFDYILVEADGAKRKSIKASADHEPVIPSETSIVFGIIGLDSIDKTICDENVHRPEIFCSVTNSHLGGTINEDIIVNLILSDKGIFKKAPQSGRKIVILNKADDDLQREKAAAIIGRVRRRSTAIECIAASAKLKAIF